MGWGRKTVLEPEPAADYSLIASAVRMTLSEQAWRGYRFNDETWQKQAWEHYDKNGQLHNAVDYIGSACSLVRLYVAEVDENGVRQGEVEDDEEIAALSENLFGGPAAKAEILRNLGASLTVAGECFLIGRAAKPGYRDQWMVVAPSEVRKQGNIVTVQVGHALREELNPTRDIIVRVWTPHPRRPMIADSPVRPLLGLLYEMEQLQLFLRSQLNSRVANAVILPVPSTLSVPKGDDKVQASDEVLEELYKVITSNLEGKGTAAAIAPVLWPMPLEELEAMRGIEPIRFESPLSEEAIKLRQEAQEKLAIGINVPVEIQLGSREMNHWGVWFAGEEFIVKSIMPLMGRIVDALTTAFLMPALKALGKDPLRYTFWYDVAPLASSANQLTDAINLNEKGIISDEAVRRIANFREGDAPKLDEKNDKFLRELMLRDPTLFTIEPVREELGIDVDTSVPELETPPPPPPAPERGIEGPQPGQRPQRPEGGPRAPEENELIASVAAPSPVRVAANGMVWRALELAGKRMLTPSHRKMFPGADVTKFHTKVRVMSEEHADTLLAGAWDYAPQYLEGTYADVPRLTGLLDSYVKGLLVRSIEHHPSLLSAYLDEAGVR